MKKRRYSPALPAESTVSGTDQTGLMPALPETDAEEEAYEELYPVEKP